MKKLFSLALTVIASSILCSCQSATPAKSTEPVAAPMPVLVKTYTTTPENVAPTTNATGPTSSFRPIYAVNTQKKIEQKSAALKCKDAAIKDAVSKAIINNNCEDFFVIRVVYEEYDNGNVVANILGYPIAVTGVEEIGVGFYEQDKDGNMKPMTKLEHKLVFRHPFFVEEVTKGTNGNPDMIVKREIPGGWTFFRYGNGALDVPKDSAPANEPPAVQSAPAKKTVLPAVPALF